MNYVENGAVFAMRCAVRFGTSIRRRPDIPATAERLYCPPVGRNAGRHASFGKSVKQLVVPNLRAVFARGIMAVVGMGGLHRPTRAKRGAVRLIDRGSGGYL